MTDEKLTAILKVMDDAIDAGLFLDEVNGEVVICTELRDISTDGEANFIPIGEDE